jgi:hypothetical protein
MQVHQKVAGGAIAGAATVIIMWGVGLLTAHYQVQVPPEVASAFTTLVSSTVAYFIPADDVPPSQQGAH